MLVQMRKEIQNCSIHGYWTRAKIFIYCSSVTWGFIYQSMFFRKICKDQWEPCLIWFLRLCTWCGQSLCKRMLISKSFCFCSLLIKHTLNHGKQQMYIFYWFFIDTVHLLQNIKKKFLNLQEIRLSWVFTWQPTAYLIEMFSRLQFVRRSWCCIW